ncbi:MAG: glycoside hydrolase family 99-like domain-containing protein [Thermoflexus sp.]|nr:glycoside hydrolase family 99-like domain-containing protein [Thermoflexus sp.]
MKDAIRIVLPMALLLGSWPAHSSPIYLPHHPRSSPVLPAFGTKATPAVVPMTRSSLSIPSSSSFSPRTVTPSTPSALPTRLPRRTPTARPTRARRTSPTPASGQFSAPAPHSIHPRVPRRVLANYLPWYDPSTWFTGCTSDSDQPRDGVYNSDDPSVIVRHIAQARSAGIDGFAVHWFAPGNRTDVNFDKVLNLSPDGFDSTVTFLYHILPGANQPGVVDALRYLIARYTSHPRFLRVAGRPVILFSDLYRIPDQAGNRPASDQDVATAVARWAEIRQIVDPQRATWWIAEGLKPDYLAVFDGLYVYKIDHACCPTAYRGATRWARWVRDWERKTGQPKLWIGTVMPGWDDLNSAQPHCADLRVSSAAFARDRENGAYYARTWEAVLPTHPDLILIHSFNEWVEGSYIEPSVRFGDLYLQLTAQWAARYKGR